MARHDYLGRRRSYRLKNKYLICYRVRRYDGSYGHYDSTLPRDISAGGLRCVIDQELSAGTELDITLRCPIFPGRSIAIRGVILHSRRDLLGQKLYKTRIKFVDFDPLLWEAFNRHIERQMFRRVNGVELVRTIDRRKHDRRKKPRR